MALGDTYAGNCLNGFNSSGLMNYSIMGTVNKILIKKQFNKKLSKQALGLEI